ncbi:MAG: endolytic transglycosylase MltG [Acidimicrobiales bacterium]
MVAIALVAAAGWAVVAVVRARTSVVVVVEPGLTVREVAAQLSRDEGAPFARTFLDAAARAAAVSPYRPAGSLEGLIGPGRYVVTPSESPGEFLDALIGGFAREARAVGLTPATTVDGLNAYQVVIAASIVQKEGYYARNMPKVARVILNRLARGGPLQMDSTVLYALGRDGGVVTHAMLETRTLYNTYLHDGLTPTPICTVSSTALTAVLHAPAGSWLYFTVVNQRGDEAFATTFTQQLANERRLATSGVR